MDDDSLSDELELLQAMYTAEEDELRVTRTAPAGTTEVTVRLQPQTGGEKAQRFMEVVLQLQSPTACPQARLIQMHLRAQLQVCRLTHLRLHLLRVPLPYRRRR